MKFLSLLDSETTAEVAGMNEERFVFSSRRPKRRTRVSKRARLSKRARRKRNASRRRSRWCAKRNRRKLRRSAGRRARQNRKRPSKYAKRRRTTSRYRARSYWRTKRRTSRQRGRASYRSRNRVRGQRSARNSWSPFGDSIISVNRRHRKSRPRYNRSRAVRGRRTTIYAARERAIRKRMNINLKAQGVSKRERKRYIRMKRRLAISRGNARINSKMLKTTLRYNYPKLHRAVRRGYATITWYGKKPYVVFKSRDAMNKCRFNRMEHLINVETGETGLSIVGGNGGDGDGGGGGGGGGGGCFIAGTKVSMGDKSTKNIEDVKIGEIVISYNEELEKNETAKVLEITSPITSRIYTINENLLTTTERHPLLVTKKDGGKGWASFNPEESLKVYEEIEEMFLLELGDEIHTINGEKIKIKTLKLEEKDTQVYNLKSVENLHTFYVNNILVHNGGGGGGS